eukprot:TRINITY_DN21058_c0_g1_i1.p1 TRINITY_DN21058_c0_g1~~TRINITY_DN21058_c0_g1_i1.p1  ORF type:complete len:311 (-),score=116.15 TRINITY_DN21058_c0_g1_i1:27-959(-)
MLGGRFLPLVISLPEAEWILPAKSAMIQGYSRCISFTRRNADGSHLGVMGGSNEWYDLKTLELGQYTEQIKIIKKGAKKLYRGFELLQSTNLNNPWLVTGRKNSALCFLFENVLATFELKRQWQFANQCSPDSVKHVANALTILLRLCPRVLQHAHLENVAATNRLLRGLMVEPISDKLKQAVSTPIQLLLESSEQAQEQAIEWLIREIASWEKDSFSKCGNVLLGVKAVVERNPDRVRIFIAKEGVGSLVHMLQWLSLIHISEPTRLLSISYAVFCLKKKKQQQQSQQQHDSSTLPTTTTTTSTNNNYS